MCPKEVVVIQFCFFFSLEKDLKLDIILLWQYGMLVKAFRVMHDDELVRASLLCPPKGLGSAFGMVVLRVARHWVPANSNQTSIPLVTH